MPQLYEVEDKEGDWIATYVKQIKGLDLSLDPYLIDKEYCPRIENMIFTDDGLQTDQGIKQYLGAVDGTPRCTHKHKLISGTIETLLITNTSVYRKVSSQWVPISDGTSTTMDGNAVQGASVIPVTSTVGFSAADLIGVELDSGPFHMTTVASVQAGVSITVDDVLPSAASSGNTVSNAYELLGSDSNPVCAVSIPFEDDVVFTNGIDNVQKWDTSANSISDLVAYKAVSLAVFDNSLILLGTTESGTQYPYRCRWCVPGDSSDWSGTDSGFEDLYDYDYPIKAGLKIGPYLAIYRSGSITRCVAENSNDKRFRFHTVITGEGIVSVNSIVDIGQTHIFVGNRNIYEYDGGFELRPIGDRIAKEFLDVNGRLEQAFRDRMFLWYDPRFFKILLFYPSQEGDYPDKAFIYNRAVGEWTERDLNKKVSCGGLASTTDILTWDDLLGTWLEQEFKWGGSTTTTERPLIILGSADEDETFEYSPNTADDDGTAIQSTLDTGDYGVPNMESRFDYVELTAAGGAISAWYSIDRGKNWVLLDTITFSADMNRKRFYNNGVGQFIFKTIRFRFQSSVFMRIQDYTFVSSVEDEVI